LRGLSPLARGTHHPGKSGAVGIRFIPAGAGNTRLAIVCGSTGLGLSPLARGTLAYICEAAVVARFIPAGAGNTRAFLPDCLRCGGLSPLARGTQIFSLPQYPGSRFIPAGAGNTATGKINHTQRPVYPRWRGEHFNVSTIAIEVSGLSPLARGTLPATRGFLRRPRFIPAGAGNTARG